MDRWIALDTARPVIRDDSSIDYAGVLPDDGFNLGGLDASLYRRQERERFTDH